MKPSLTKDLRDLWKVNGEQAREYRLFNNNQRMPLYFKVFGFALFVLVSSFLIVAYPICRWKDRRVSS